MDAAAIAGLVGLVLIKEIGVPLPLPGDLLIIGAGAYLAGDPATAAATLAAILVAGYIGASIQFLLFGTALRRPLLAALARLGIGVDRLQRLSDRFRAAGLKAVAATRMTPGVRIAVVPAAAIAALPYRVFLLGIIIGNGVFVTVHFAAGYLLGNSARELIGRASDPMVIAIGALVVVAVVGLVVLWRRRSPTGPVDAYECWADCSCPACLAVVTLA